MAGWQDYLSRCHVSYLQNAPGLLGKSQILFHKITLALFLQRMVAGYRQSCMAILMNYASQCATVCCGDSKTKINIKYFLILASNNNLSQVCKSAVCVCTPQCGPGSNPGLGAICGLSLLVLVLAPKAFSPGIPVFPSPQKPTFLNSNSIWNPRATGSVVRLLSVTLVKQSYCNLVFFIHV